MCGGRVRIHQKGETGGVVILWSKKGGYSLLVKFFLGKSLSAYSIFNPDIFYVLKFFRKSKMLILGSKEGRI